MRAMALLVRLGLEICILIALAGMAAHWAAPFGMRVLLGIVLCAAAGGVWGMLLSPKRKYEIGTGGRLFLEALLFMGTAAIVYYSGHPAWAVAVIVIATADRIALALFP